MNYEWDPAKNLENIKKHKVSFEQAVIVLEDPYRFYEDTIRIISARRANRNEMEAYNENCSLFFGKHTQTH
jgi:uncharacterized DUF497 family protein